ncbi:Major facilitator superfamily domain, general substrate transporter [Penicillium occitanis (nom. inval.)]|nr:hypothetical protein PENOC_082070 [Penicillium occitanis (nom. inval.)]PCH04282.1 Major facilitator superfamily domain, general substrate transporter [Penicillium occitanis (nom. inval.)]
MAFKNYRVYILTAVAYLGSLLFGYDTGVMGSVLALKSFKHDFGLPTDSSGFASSRNAKVSSNVVSLLTAGCFFGSIFAAFLNERIGRRYGLMVFSSIFMIGAAVQVGAHHHIGQIYGGRVIAGFGIGGMSAITPVLRIPQSTKQWRIPVAIQLIPGGLMFIGLFFLKESPRWLMRQGRYEEAHASLAYIRNEPQDSEEVLKEFSEIRASLEEELAATEGVTWKEAISKSNRYRFFLAFCLMFWQQFSGTNSIGYYAPQIFQTVGVSSTNTSLFATGVYGSVKVVMTLIFLLVGIDFIGRKKALIGGGIWMSTMMIIIGAVLATHPPNTKSDVVSPASIAMIVLIYLYVIGYSASWGPTPWVYVSEIFPTRLRAYGVGLAAATQWLFNFVITEITPNAVNHIGWRTFLMFGIFCLAMSVFVTFFVKETKGRSLEDMDILFGSVDEAQRAADVEQVLNKAHIAQAEHSEHLEMARRDQEESENKEVAH